MVISHSYGGAGFPLSHARAKSRRSIGDEEGWCVNAKKVKHFSCHGRSRARQRAAYSQAKQLLNSKSNNNVEELSTLERIQDFTEGGSILVPPKAVPCRGSGASSPENFEIQVLGNAISGVLRLSHGVLRFLFLLTARPWAERGS